jgi:hypothetical protein
MELRSAVSQVVDVIANASSYLLGVEFQDIDYGGASWIWASSDYCHWYTDDYYSGSMPAGWNDIVSSAKSYNGCGYFYHYENESWNYVQAGAVVDCGWECSYIGDGMNDRTSSIILSYWG